MSIWSIDDLDRSSNDFRRTGFEPVIEVTLFFTMFVVPVDGLEPPNPRRELIYSQSQLPLCDTGRLVGELRFEQRCQIFKF